MPLTHDRDEGLAISKNMRCVNCKETHRILRLGYGSVLAVQRHGLYREFHRIPDELAYIYPMKTSAKYPDARAKSNICPTGPGLGLWSLAVREKK